MAVSRNASGLPRLIGMVHLGALPGAPQFKGGFDSVIAAAVGDAVAIEKAGFEAVMVENFGDVPFFADDVPKVTVAAMSVVAQSIAAAVGVPVGINVLRNDAAASLAIAAATGASMIRVNVLSGTMYTDQGPIVSKAAEVGRLRASIAPDVAILADVFVKHAIPPPGLSVTQVAEDTLDRGGADALVVSGSSTGRKPPMATVRAVTEVAGDRPVFVGSGVTAATVGRYLAAAHGAIVGTFIKRRGITTSAVDPKRARAIVNAHQEARRSP